MTTLRHPAPDSLDRLLTEYEAAIATRNLERMHAMERAVSMEVYLQQYQNHRRLELLATRAEAARMVEHCCG